MSLNKLQCQFDKSTFAQIRPELSTLITPLMNELLCQLFRALREQWISAKMKV
jgi:hypothetical protein